MDRHGAWQREFSMLLKLFTQWLKAESLCNAEVLQSIASLENMAHREPTHIAILCSDEELRLRVVHALCVNPNQASQAHSPKSLKWAGLRTWTFDPDKPSAIGVGNEKTLNNAPPDQTRASDRSHGVSLLLAPGYPMSQRTTFEDAQVFLAAGLAGAPRQHEQKPGANAPSTETYISSREFTAGPWHCYINQHRTEFQNELCIHEYPVNQLGRDETDAMALSIQQSEHYLWVVDANGFDTEVETLLYFSIFRQEIKKRKTLWLIVFKDTEQSRHGHKLDINSLVDPAVKEWALGLGLATEQIMWIKKKAAEPLDVRTISDKLQQTKIRERRMQWGEEIRGCIEQLKQQTLAVLDTLVRDRHLRTEKLGAARQNRQRLVDKARNQAASVAQQSLEYVSQLNALRHAQLNLRVKVWAALDEPNQMMGLTKARTARRIQTGPDQLRLLLLEWFDVGKQSLEVVGALTRAGATIFAKEYQVHSKKNPVDKVLGELPNVQPQIERMIQHKNRNLSGQLRWESLTMSEAYEQARIAQIGLDSILETTRTQTSVWFEKILNAIDTQSQAYLQKHQRNARLLEQLNAPNYQPDKELTSNGQNDDGVQKLKLEKQIELLKAAVMDALTMGTEAGVGANKWLDSPSQSKSHSQTLKAAQSMAA